jgi:hypothetical protein
MLPKSVSLLPILVLALALSSTAFAAGSGHELSLSAGTAVLNYEESRMQEEGVLYGAGLSYAYLGEAGWSLGMEGEIWGGRVEYDGETWGGAPLSSEGDDYILGGRGTAGWVFSRGLIEVELFTGFGARYWNDDQEGSGFYERETTYYYSPLGLRVSKRFAPDKRWRLQAAAEYDLFWAGRNESHLSDADPAFNDPVLETGFGDGWGLRISCTVTRVMESLSVSATPFLRYWDVEASDKEDLTSGGVVVGRVYEPENETSMAGILLALSF